MTQSETRVQEHLGDITRQNIETLAAIQKQLLDVLNKANHEWVTFLNEEAELASNLSKKNDDGPIDSRRHGSLPRVDKPADGTDDTASENNL